MVVVAAGMSTAWASMFTRSRLVVIAPSLRSWDRGRPARSLAVSAGASETPAVPAREGAIATDAVATVAVATDAKVADVETRIWRRP